MVNKHIRSYYRGMNEIQADDELKKKILRSAKSNQSRKKTAFFSIGIASACIAVVCAIAMFAFWGTSSKPRQPLFDGFAITAYAANGAPVEVKPQVHFPLGSYQMTMSSVPGFPIKIGSDTADSIRLIVTDGELLEWNPPNYQVRNRGKEMEIRSGKTIYWSPLSDDGKAAIATKTTLEIKAYQNKKEIGSQFIEITSDGNYSYSGFLRD